MIVGKGGKARSVATAVGIQLVFRQVGFVGRENSVQAVLASAERRLGKLQRADALGLPGTNVLLQIERFQISASSSRRIGHSREGFSHPQRHELAGRELPTDRSGGEYAGKLCAE